MKVFLIPLYCILLYLLFNFIRVIIQVIFPQVFLAIDVQKSILGRDSLHVSWASEIFFSLHLKSNFLLCRNHHLPISFSKGSHLCKSPGMQNKNLQNLYVFISYFYKILLSWNCVVNGGLIYKYPRKLNKDQMTNQSLQSALGCRKVVMHCVGSFRCRTGGGKSRAPLTTGEQIKEENPRVMENWNRTERKLRHGTVVST